MPPSRPHAEVVRAFAEIETGTESGVHVLVDPSDSIHVLRLIEGRADEPHCAVVTPTPGTNSITIFFEDLVRCVGFPAHENRRQGLRNRALFGSMVWTLRTAEIRELYVLRAHLVAPRVWRDLMVITDKAPSRLCFVVHQDRPTRAQLAALEGVDASWHRAAPRERLFDRSVRHHRRRRAQPRARVAQ
jgi:hypothetical protein